MPTPFDHSYLDSLDQGFQDSAQAENLSALRDVADALVQSRVLHRDIAEREEQVKGHSEAA